MTGSLFSRLFGRARRDEEPPARMTADEAERIARNAVAGRPLADQLVSQGRRKRDGHLVWWFWTPTKGSSLEVEVDDRTGEPTVRKFGGR